MGRKRTPGANRPRPRGEYEAVKHIDQAKKMQKDGAINVVRLPGIGFPDELRTVLKYKQNGVSLTGTTTPSARVFRINSCFDPDLTGTGHQPNFFDQLTAIYGRYCVTGAQLIAHVINEGTVEVDCVLVYSDQDISADTVENLSEVHWSRNKVAGIQNSGKSVVTLALPPCSIANLQGQREIRGDPNNYTLITTNPVDQVFGIFKLSSADAITNVKAIVNFELWLDVTFNELGAPTESLLKKKVSSKFNVDEETLTPCIADESKEQFDQFCSFMKQYESWRMTPPLAKS